MADDSSIDIAKIEYDKLGGFQETYYKGKVETRFQFSDRKIGWNTNIDERLEFTERNGGKCEFTVDKKQFHFLTGIYIIVKIPTIKIKQKYKSNTRICFTNNLLHHIHNEGALSMGKKITHSLNSYILDLDRISRIRDIIMYDDDIGNRDELTSWTTKISTKKPLMMYPPWFFNIHKNVPLPLHDKCVEKSKISFLYKFKLKLKDLISVKRLKVKGSDEWVKVPFNDTYLEKVSDIPVPEMWGQYNNITDAEIKERHNIEEYEVNYVDYHMIPNNDTNKSGESTSIELKCTSPVAGIAWMAQNQESFKNNILSNYTTDKNLHEGVNPSIVSEIKYGTRIKIKEKEHWHFDNILPKRYFGHSLVENGYNFYMFDDNPLSTRVGNSINFNAKGIHPVTLNCKLENIDPDEDSNDSDSDSEILYPDDMKTISKNDNKYKYIVILYVLKKLIFNNKIMKMFYISDDIMYTNYKEAI